eukprot:3781183-Pleurochrysis_carterae.AAC.1
MHTDNAGDLTSKQIAISYYNNGVRLTTISPQVPRQNGACERQWRTRARDMRAKLATSKLPASYWWPQRTFHRYSRCAMYRANHH